MGYAVALRYAEAVADGDIGLLDALRVHLTSNFYPPQPGALAEYLATALVAVADGEPDTEILLPGGYVVTAGTLVEDCRAEPFLAVVGHEG